MFRAVATRCPQGWLFNTSSNTLDTFHTLLTISFVILILYNIIIGIDITHAYANRQIINERVQVTEKIKATYVKDMEPILALIKNIDGSDTKLLANYSEFLKDYSTKIAICNSTIHEYQQEYNNSTALLLFCKSYSFVIYPITL
jgi:L-rhamnose isomerase